MTAVPGAAAPAAQGPDAGIGDVGPAGDRGVEAKDAPVRLTGPKDWLVLVTVLGVLVGGAAWGVGAKLPRWISAGGLLTSPGGTFAVQSPVAGQVTDVPVRVGMRVRAGSVVARVSARGVVTAVRSPSDGDLYAVPVRAGQVVGFGSTLARGESRTRGLRLVAVLYLPAAAPAQTGVGDPVELRVPSAAVEQYGVLRGRVAAVDPVPSSAEEIADFVGDGRLAGMLAPDGVARRVVVELVRSATTVSGYAWSTRDGPPFRIVTRTMVTGDLPLPPERPLDWVLPR
jgi:biotin carboxyl carrier protein